MAEPTNQPRIQQAQPMIQGMTNEQVVEVITRLVQAMKEPTDEEKQKKAEQLARKQEMARQAIQTAEQEMNNRMSLHTACIHKNARMHTFVAQNTGNGNTVAICQICGKDYKWRTTQDQLRQGVNLVEYVGLTEQHLLDWEKRFPAVGDPPDRIKLLTRAGKTV